MLNATCNKLWRSAPVRPQYLVSPRPVRHGPRQASQLSGTYLPDDFSCDAWRGPCLTGRGGRERRTPGGHWPLDEPVRNNGMAREPLGPAR